MNDFMFEMRKVFVKHMEIACEETVNGIQISNVDAAVCAEFVCRVRDSMIGSLLESSRNIYKLQRHELAQLQPPQRTEPTWSWLDKEFIIS